MTKKKDFIHNKASDKSTNSPVVHVNDFPNRISYCYQLMLIISHK